MTTFADQIAAAKPQAMPLDEIPSVPELDMVLEREAGSQTRTINGKTVTYDGRARFQGSLDEAGTVHAKLYVPGNRVDELIGSVVTFDADDRRPGFGRANDGLRVSKDGTVGIMTFDAEGLTLVLYAPTAGPAIEGVRLSL